jgi:hypothetical protein
MHEPHRGKSVQLAGCREVSVEHFNKEELLERRALPLLKGKLLFTAQRASLFP